MSVPFYTTGRRDVPVFSKVLGKGLGHAVVWVQKSKQGFEARARSSEMFQVCSLHFPSHTFQTHQDLARKVQELHVVREDLRRELRVFPSPSMLTNMIATR
jgi:hypothetical protein